MASLTSNLGLTKPSWNDTANIYVLNKNFDKIDAIMPIVYPYTIPAGRVYGDINGDGYVDITDLKLINKHINSENGYLTDETQLKCADTNKDGNIDDTDLSMIQNCINGEPAAKFFDDTLGKWNRIYSNSMYYYYYDIVFSSNLDGATKGFGMLITTSDSDLYQSIVKTEVGLTAGGRTRIRFFATHCPVSNVSCEIYVFKSNRANEATYSKLLCFEYIQNKTFKNLTITKNDWEDSLIYTGFPVSYDIPIKGAVSSYSANVRFAFEEVVSGNFAPIADILPGIVRIYAKNTPTKDFIIPYVILEKID